MLTNLVERFYFPLIKFDPPFLQPEGQNVCIMSNKKTMFFLGLR